MRSQAKSDARALAAQVKPIWSDLTSNTVDPRKEILRCMAVDETGTALQAGIAGVYPEACARAGDTSAYELMAELGMSPDFSRPKQQGGRAQAGMRSFIVYILAVQLMEKHPELRLGANDATAPGTSAIDIIRAALEEAGLPCIDARKDESEGSGTRSMERAVQRMRNSKRFRELFDPAWTEAYEAGCSSC